MQLLDLARIPKVVRSRNPLFSARAGAKIRNPHPRRKKGKRGQFGSSALPYASEGPRCTARKTADLVPIPQFWRAFFVKMPYPSAHVAQYNFGSIALFILGKHPDVKAHCVPAPLEITWFHYVKRRAFASCAADGAQKLPARAGWTERMRADRWKHQQATGGVSGGERNDRSGW